MTDYEIENWFLPTLEAFIKISWRPFIEDLSEDDILESLLTVNKSLISEFLRDPIPNRDYKFMLNEYIKSLPEAVKLTHNSRIVRRWNVGNK